MRLRVSERHTGRQNQIVYSGKVQFMKIHDWRTFAGSHFPRRISIIPREHFCATCQQRLNAGQSGPCQPEHRDLFS